jgi:hypothetical protein
MCSAQLQEILFACLCSATFITLDDGEGYNKEHDVDVDVGAGAGIFGGGLNINTRQLLSQENKMKTKGWILWWLGGWLFILVVEDATTTSTSHQASQRTLLLFLVAHISVLYAPHPYLALAATQDNRQRSLGHCSFRTRKR